VADQDDVKPSGAERHAAIASAGRLNPTGFHPSAASISSSYISRSRSLDDQHRLAAPERQRRWANHGGAVYRRRGAASKRLPCSGLLCTFIAPSWSRTISCTVAILIQSPPGGS
jgi:hypothetical protein